MPRPEQVSIEKRDERTITVPVGAAMNDLRIAATSNDDWRLKTISEITSGHQRDPYTTGVKLTFERVG